MKRRLPFKPERKATVTRVYPEHGHDDVPFIRLRGKWLRQAGFEVGDEMVIRVSEGRLEILTVPHTPNA